MSAEATRPPSAAILMEGRALLDAALADGRVGVAYVAALADAYDRYFRERLDEMVEAGTEGPSFALVAVGGYGRRELCPASDIDVLLVFGGETPECATALARFLFFPLWDMGVELGHGARTIGQCLDLAKADPQVLASLLDLRFLAGDEEVARGLATRLAVDVFPSGAAGFVDWLAAGNEVKRRAHGDAGAMLEPNLKNGLGGLRDWHQVRWLSGLARDRGANLSGLDQELAALSADGRFLLTVRAHLHRLSGRKNDKLYFEFQERLAAVMGFADEDGMRGVERFLSRLLRLMADIKDLRQSVWPLLAGACGAMDLSVPAIPVVDGVELAPEGLRFAPGLSDAEAMERIFPLLLACAKKTIAPAHDTAKRLGALAGPLAELSRVSPRTGRAIFDGVSGVMLADAEGVALDALSRTGLLRAVLPEFARVEDLVSFDLYHVHPVGRHSLEAVRLLAEIRRGGQGRYSEIMAGLPRPELVFWGALLHDVGKGLGGEHSEKGGELAEAMLAALSAPPEARHAVADLVREHLLLPDTATGRDLADRDVVARVAGRVSSVEMLDMLTLIARCDGVATGPQAWTGWKESLVFELAAKVRVAIEQGRLFDAKDAAIMRETRDRLRELARGRMAPEALERALPAMPPRYLVAVAPKDILAHLELLAELDAAEAEHRRMRTAQKGVDDAVVLTHERLPREAGFAVTVAARHVRALFPTVTGVLALHDLSIHDADVFVWDDGVTILALRTGNPPDVLYADEVFGRVSRAIRYTLAGKLFLDYRLSQKRGSYLCAPGPRGPKCPPKVHLDNRISDLYTVIDVSCDDRVGLLYDVARTLSELRLETHLAKVMTPGGRVRDVFYVRVAGGGRVEDPEQIVEIKAALAHRLREGDPCATV
jgi:[protein-PII] uridylyltransferase